MCMVPPCAPRAIINEVEPRKGYPIGYPYGCPAGVPIEAHEVWPIILARKGAHVMRVTLG